MGDGEEPWQKPFTARCDALSALDRAGEGDTPEATALRDALNDDWAAMLPYQREWAEPLLARTEGRPWPDRRKLL